MNGFPWISRAFSPRVRPFLRATVCVVLAALLGMEILPSGIVACLPALPGEASERTARIESLQVCDHGDGFLGALFELSVLLPGAPGLFPSNEALPLVPQARVLVPEGFKPAIERPPRRSS